jgi:hypothetical protein
VIIMVNARNKQGLDRLVGYEIIHPVYGEK